MGAGHRDLAAFVVNGSRPARLGNLHARFAAAAAARGWPAPLVLPTSSHDAGTAMASQAQRAGATVVFAVGGDGTVRACAQALASTGVPLAIIPAGSANLTARALGVPLDLPSALAAGFDGPVKAVDLASVDGTVCAAMAGLGTDAAVVGATPDWIKRRAGWPAYAVLAIGHLLETPAEFTIWLDDELPLTCLARTVVVGNCGLLPGGFPILPDAQPDDGILDVGVLAPRGLAGWASIGYRAVTASRRDDGQLSRYRAAAVRIEASVPLPRQIDGEVIGTGTAMTVTVLPGVLQVKMPQPARPLGRQPG